MFSGIKEVIIVTLFILYIDTRCWKKVVLTLDVLMYWQALMKEIIKTTS